MTFQVAETSRPPRRVWRSIGALLAGFLSVVVLSIGTDQVFHMLDVYPPWGEPMADTSLLLLALGYRCVYGVLGSFIAAWLAPRAPMGHALALGFIGLVPGVAGMIAMWDVGPNWFPVALVLTTLPCAWLGGVVYGATQPDR